MRAAAVTRDPLIEWARGQVRREICVAVVVAIGALGAGVAVLFVCGLFSIGGAS